MVFATFWWPGSRGKQFSKNRVSASILLTQRFTSVWNSTPALSASICNLLWRGIFQKRNRFLVVQFCQWEKGDQDKQKWLLKSATSAAREETWRPAAGDTFWQLEQKPLFWSVSFPNPSVVHLCDLCCIKALSGVGWQPFVDLSARRKAGQSTGLIAGYTFLFWVMITANVNSIIAKQNCVKTDISDDNG